MAIRNTADLRHRVSLQRPAEPEIDAQGYPKSLDGQWEEVTKTWALVRDVSGKEFFEAYATQALRVVTIELRALPGIGIDNSWSVVFQGVRYYLLHINHRDYKGKWLELKAQNTRPEQAGGDAFERIGDDVIGDATGAG